MAVDHGDVDELVIARRALAEHCKDGLLDQREDLTDVGILPALFVDPHAVEEPICDAEEFFERLLVRENAPEGLRLCWGGLLGVE